MTGELVVLSVEDSSVSSFSPSILETTVVGALVLVASVS